MGERRILILKLLCKKGVTKQNALKMYFFAYRYRTVQYSYDFFNNYYDLVLAN